MFAKDSQLQSIGRCAFEGTGLEEFIAPANLRTIRASAFKNCSALTTVDLGNELETLESQCFYGT